MGGNDRLLNGPPPPTVPNGAVHPNPASRAVHDGFATIRTAKKRSRICRSSPSVVIEPQTTANTCPACCPTPSPVMEPLWEEHGGSSGSVRQNAVVRRDPKVPWWELATRRSRYRSCPAFSQANIMSALEQTVTDVTDRLERLASSPDLKASEAEELRRSAAVLRRQSSAVSQSVSSGYFSLERQASCDSVSSVSSSLSNATHLSMNSVIAAANPMMRPSSNHSSVSSHPNHHRGAGGAEDPAAKNKKRSWLRASFRRAFGKQNRKRNKLPDPKSTSHPLDSISKNESSNRTFILPQTVGAAPPQPSSGSLSDMCSQHRAIMTQRIESEELFQNLLQEKEKALLDAKTELLSAHTEMKKQTEMISKLQIECSILKEENCRLLSLVEKKFGSISEASLNPLIDHLNSLNINNSKGNNTLSVDKKGKTLKVFAVENVSLETACQASHFKEDGKKMLFGSVIITPKMTWEELDNSIAQIFEEYCSRLDPGNSLGLGRESLFCYKLAESVRGDGIPKPDLLPYGYSVGKLDGIYLWLKGPLQKDSENPQMGNMASIAFSQCLPTVTLNTLATLLQETRRVMIVGPPASGKTFLATQLARAYVVSKGIANPDHKTITLFTVNGSNSLELCRVLSQIWPNGKSSVLNSNPTSEEKASHFTPEVLVIDDIDAASGVVETLQRCLPLSTQKAPAVIATCSNSPSLVTRLQVHCYFRWVGLSVQEEPVKGLLGRILRRPLLTVEETTGINLPAVHRTIDWLSRLWQHLNSVLANSGLDASLGPTLLADCPLDQNEALAWFQLKWNTCLAPKFNEFIRQSFNKNWVNPKEWIVATFPWSGQQATTVLNQLISIEAEKEVKVPASPSFRIVPFPQRQTLKPQTRMLECVPKCNSQNDSSSITSKAEDRGVTNSGEDPLKRPMTPILGSFSTFLKMSPQFNDRYKSNTFDTYSAPRRDYNMNNDILKIAKDKTDDKTAKEENRKFTILL